VAAAAESAKSRRARRADPPPQFSDPEQAGESESPHRLFSCLHATAAVWSLHVRSPERPGRG